MHALDNATALQVSDAGDVERLISVLKVRAERENSREKKSETGTKELRRRISLFNLEADGALRDDAPYLSNDTGSARRMTTPDSAFRLLWGAMTLVLAVVSSVLSPLLLGWSGAPADNGDRGASGSPGSCMPGLVYTELLLDFWFLLTIALNFRTGVMVDGLLQMKPSIVARVCTCKAITDATPCIHS